MKKILYIGNFSFPVGNAAGKRVYANGKILKKLGYEVIFIGTDYDIQAITKLQDTKEEYDGFEFYNFPYPTKSISWINYNKTYKLLVNFIEEEIGISNIEMIIYYGSPTLSLFINKLIKLSRKNNIKVVSDCVDWLTVRTNNPVFNFVKWLDTTYQKTCLNKRVDGVIAISKFLEGYYSKTGLKTVVIPPLSPQDCKEVVANNKEYKVIVYAGIPFRTGQIIKDLSTLKDRIDKTIILLYEAKKRGAYFKFNIYGFTKAEYLKSIPSQKKYVVGLEDSIVFHGMKSNKEVTKEISRADFTILIRDVTRDTTAGFPTKVSESISCGTPVIVTRTSDLENYIVDGKNGILIDVENCNQAIDEITQVLLKNKIDVFNMKQECINSGTFSYEKYIYRLKEFVFSL
ncbi:glycosyltransferase [Desemzia sp. FAM 23991]|uniref:glycosyltransferase n=1 Tax=unclassified Desemzia TaxID=2685243 RepID=UPI00388585C6